MITTNDYLTTWSQNTNWLNQNGTTDNTKVFYWYSPYEPGYNQQWQSITGEITIKRDELLRMTTNDEWLNRFDGIAPKEKEWDD